MKSFVFWISRKVLKNTSVDQSGGISKDGTICRYLMPKMNGAPSSGYFRYYTTKKCSPFSCAEYRVWEGLGIELGLQGKIWLVHSIKRPWLLRHSQQRKRKNQVSRTKRKNRPPYALLSGKSSLRGVAAFTRPQKAAVVGLLLEKDQETYASLTWVREGCHAPPSLKIA